MVGRIPSNSWAPVVPVAGAAVGAVVLGRRAIVNSWVPEDPVVGGAVGVVVVRSRAISHSWGLVNLVGGVRPALTAGAVCLGVRPADGGRRSIVLRPKAGYQAHNERHALLLFPGAFSRLCPGHIHREVVLRQLFSATAGTGDNCCRCLRKEAPVGPGRHASDTPPRNSVSLGLRVRASTATSLRGCWC